MLLLSITLDQWAAEGEEVFSVQPWASDAFPDRLCDQTGSSGNLLAELHAVAAAFMNNK